MRSRGGNSGNAYPSPSQDEVQDEVMKVYPEEFIDEYIKITGGIVITGLCFLGLLSISALGLLSVYLMGWL